jgi:hypothetical protein
VRAMVRWNDELAFRAFEVAAPVGHEAVAAIR